MNRDDRSRRTFLRAGGLAGVTALAGCSSPFGDGGDGSHQTTTAGPATLEDFRGSGPMVEQRPQLQGTSVDDLPDLSGKLTIYLGGGEGGRYTDLLKLFRRIYPDFQPETRSAGSAQQANTIIEESRGGGSPADVFWAVDAGSLGVVADEGATVELPSRIVDPVPDQFHPNGQWVGVAGRARSIPYNTEQLSADDVPDSVMEFPSANALNGATGWAPTYGAFQSFITAMRLLEGEEATKQWLNGMLDAGVDEYPNEFVVSNAIADGEIGAGFANHYYALRVRASRPDSPLELAFTSGDAGALINVSGAEIIDGTDNEELAANFIHHLLSVEAQEFFATRTFAYPMIGGVPPVGGLPRVDELNPPSLDLQKLSNVQPTLKLMREVGVL